MTRRSRGSRHDGSRSPDRCEQGARANSAALHSIASIAIDPRVNRRQRAITHLLTLTLLAALDAGCTKKALSCVPGQSAACVCVDGRSGAQTCNPDGTYAACVCQSPSLVPGLPAIPGLTAPVPPPQGAVPGMPQPPAMPIPIPPIPGFTAPPPGAPANTAPLCTQARACCAAIAADPSLVSIEGLCQMGAWGGAMAAGDPGFSSAYCGYVMTSVSAMLSGLAMEAQQHGRPFTYPAACRQPAP